MSGFGMAHRVVYGQAGLNKVQVVDERRDHKGTSGHLRILVILVMFLLLMMIASIIISVVSLSHWNRKDDGYDRYNGYNGYNSEYEKYRKYYHDNYGKDPPGAPSPPSPYYPPKDEHVYTIAFGDDWGDHQEIDEGENCAQRGWGLKLVKAACEAVHLTCKTVYMPDKWCIDYFEKEDFEDHPVIGKGLLNSGITACGGWFPDPERYNLLKFSAGYLRNPKIYLWYPSSSTRPTISTSTRIGFAYASPWNEKCLKRYLEKLQEETNVQLVPYDGVGAAAAGLTSTPVQVDLILASDLFERSGLTEWSDEHMICASGPAGLASNKKNKAFLEKFSKGLELIRGNGVMKEICDSHNPGTDVMSWCVNTYWA